MKSFVSITRWEHISHDFSWNYDIIRWMVAVCMFSFLYFFLVMEMAWHLKGVKPFPGPGVYTEKSCLPICVILWDTFLSSLGLEMAWPYWVPGHIQDQCWLLFFMDMVTNGSTAKCMQIEIIFCLCYLLRYSTFVAGGGDGWTLRGDKPFPGPVVIVFISWIWYL